MLWTRPSGDSGTATECVSSLTPSLSEPVKCPGWKMHGRWLSPVPLLVLMIASTPLSADHRQYPSQYCSLPVPLSVLITANTFLDADKCQYPSQCWSSPVPLSVLIIASTFLSADHRQYPSHCWSSPVPFSVLINASTPLSTDHCQYLSLYWRLSRFETALLYHRINEIRG